MPPYLWQEDQPVKPRLSRAELQPVNLESISPQMLPYRAVAEPANMFRVIVPLATYACPQEFPEEKRIRNTDEQFAVRLQQAVHIPEKRFLILYVFHHIESANNVETAVELYVLSFYCHYVIAECLHIVHFGLVHINADAIACCTRNVLVQPFVVIIGTVVISGTPDINDLAVLNIRDKEFSFFPLAFAHYKVCKKHFIVINKCRLEINFQNTQNKQKYAI